MTTMCCPSQGYVGLGSVFWQRHAQVESIMRRSLYAYLQYVHLTACQAELRLRSTDMT